jgi:ABC-type polysaccharide/polyol phosphate export permease
MQEGTIQRILGSRMHQIELIMLLVKRELKVKYRDSFLGYLWSMLNPLLFMIIISFVFSFIVRGIENYNLFILSSILFWNFFSLTLNLGTTAIVRNALLLQKVKVPVWIFPVVPAGLAITNFALSLIPYAVLYAWQKHTIPAQLWLAPFIMGFAMVFACGIVLGLSSLNVFFRDISHILEPLLTLTFYATPIIYDRNAPSMPSYVKDLLQLNPLTHFIEAFRAAILGQGQVSAMNFVVLFGLTASAVIFGGVVYKLCRQRIIYFL